MEDNSSAEHLVIKQLWFWVVVSSIRCRRLVKFPFSSSRIEVAIEDHYIAVYLDALILE